MKASSLFPGLLMTWLLPAASLLVAAPGDISTTGDCVVQCAGGQPGLHPGVDAVADDPVGEDVLDRTHVQLSLT